jgi:hypothetical protein
VSAREGGKVRVIGQPGMWRRRTAGRGCDLAGDSSEFDRV